MLGHKEHVHHMLTGSAFFHGTTYFLHTLLETVGDSDALIRNPLPLKLLAFGFRFGGRNDLDLFGLSIFFRRLFQTLGSIDLIHRILHFGIWINVGHQRFYYFVPEARDGFCQLVLYSNCDFVFFTKNIIEIEVWDFGTNRIENV